MVTFSNPDSVHPPLGPYSHVAAVPEGTELLFLSGQLGVRPDGSTPVTMTEQADQAFANVIALVKANGFEASDIVKLTIFIVVGHDGKEVGAARLKHLASHRPASTIVYISQLAAPDWFLEVEAIAARPRDRA